MNYIEKYQNLFDEKNCYYAHCISSDFGMGAGIVVEFNKRYNMKNVLKAKYPNGFVNECDNSKIGVIVEDNVFNLVTKDKVWQKPTYKTMEKALSSMKEFALNNHIQTIAMPKIGCGIDGLEWNKVRDILFKVFYDTDISIIVCYI